MRAYSRKTPLLRLYARKVAGTGRGEDGTSGEKPGGDGCGGDGDAGYG